MPAFQKNALLHHLVIICFLVTVLVYPFTETLLLNSSEFSFRVLSVMGYAAGGILLLYIVLGLIGMLLNKSDIYVLVLFVLTVAAYMQQMFMNGELFLMDGIKDRWSIGIKLFNILAWFLILAVVFGLRYRFKEKMLSAVKWIAAALIVMQLVGVVSLFVSNIGSSEIKSSITTDYFCTEGMYEVASDENVMIFVLDTYDIDYINEVLEKQPDFLSPLKGFTYFPDTVSQFSRTFPSIPYMLTNELYFYEKPYVEYCDEAYEKNDFWDKVLENGYELYFYEESSEYVGSDLRKKAKNYVAEGHAVDAEISAKGIFKAMGQISAYRVLPYMVKDYFSYTAKTINSYVVSRRIWDRQRFYVDDAAVYGGLRESGLVVNEDTKAVRFYHFNGAHAPYTMNETGAAVDEKKGDKLAQYIGCMNMVYDYLDELTRLGLYEDATIIITADHGENYVTETLEQNTNPILFIKPAGSYQEELVVSNVYASQNDMLPTLGSILDVKVEADMGIDLFDDSIDDVDRVRYHYYTVVENTEQTKTRTYEIKGSSLDFANWSATDEYHEFVYY